MKTDFIAYSQVLRKAHFKYYSLPMAKGTSTEFSYIIQQFLMYKTIV